ncbi:MAG: hypothetical protein HY900_30335 [Deltaproteobacteria bacterium]|nr:hypothetical protein [Deltaproteobacteria bacterium]
MNRHRRSSASTCSVWAFVALFLLSGQGHSLAAEKGVLRFGTGTDATTLDPHNWKSATDLLAINQIYEGLMTLDRSLKIVPVLATSWKAVNDTTWRFTLRKGVKFQDGTDFNAEAARINLERMRNAPRSKSYFGMIESVTVEDAYTIVIKTQTPYAPFLNNMCHPVGAMISPAAIEKYGKELGEHPVGTGKFKLKEWRRKERLVLERNDAYWGAKPQLRQFDVIPIPEEGTRTMAFEAGDVDVIADPLPNRLAAYRAGKNVDVIQEPAARVVWMGFNVSDKTVGNADLRRALALAINRDELVKYVAEGLVGEANSWIPAVVQQAKTSRNYPFDPRQAKQLLAKAGYPNGLELNLWTPEGRYLKDRQIAEAIQAQLSKIGVRVKVRVMEWGTYLDSLTRHEQQLYINGWAYQVGDPDSVLRDNFYSASSYNFSNYKSQDYDKLLDASVAMLNPSKRRSLIEKAEARLLEDVVGVPVYHKNNIYAVSKKVQGFRSHPLELIILDGVNVN